MSIELCISSHNFRLDFILFFKVFRFDDLIVSAPFEFYNDEDIEYGGAVYIYYSNGKRQIRGANAKVFREPIVLRIQGAHSQFGTALTKLGNLNNDPQNFQGILSVNNF